MSALNIGHENKRLVRCNDSMSAMKIRYNTNVYKISANNMSANNIATKLVSNNMKMELVSNNIKRESNTRLNNRTQKI